eukprot:2796861-Pleurochrysis_carterae.AAC.1
MPSLCLRQFVALHVPTKQGAGRAPNACVKAVISQRSVSSEPHPKTPACIRSTHPCEGDGEEAHKGECSSRRSVRIRMWGCPHAGRARVERLASSPLPLS